MSQSHITKKIAGPTPSRPGDVDDRGYPINNDFDFERGTTDADYWRRHHNDATTPPVIHQIQQLHEFDDLENGVPDR